jgi:hypothetical protein
MHEPYRRMIQLAHDKVHKLNKFGADGTRAYLKNVIPVPAGPQLAGIVDHKLTHFIPELVELFPRSKFIWLTRDGRKVVRSIVARGWYTDEEAEKAAKGAGGIWAAYRLQLYHAGVVSEGDWRQMSQFERCCWYWAWMTHTCREALALYESLTPRSWTMFPIEEGAELLSGLQEWLGLEPVPLSMYRANQGPRTEAQPWTGGEHVLFDRICGPEMDRCYPGWRDDDG